MKHSQLFVAESREIANVETGDWQLALALICVGLAVVALGRRMRRFWFGQAVVGCTESACDSCTNQPEPNSSPAERQLVSIQLPDQKDGG